MNDPMQWLAGTWHTRGCRARCALRCVDDPVNLLAQIARGYKAAAGSSCDGGGGGSSAAAAWVAAAAAQHIAHQSWRAPSRAAQTPCRLDRAPMIPPAAAPR